MTSSPSSSTGGWFVLHPLLYSESRPVTTVVTSKEHMKTQVPEPDDGRTRRGKVEIGPGRDETMCTVLELLSQKDWIVFLSSLRTVKTTRLVESSRYVDLKREDYLEQVHGRESIFSLPTVTPPLPLFFSVSIVLSKVLILCSTVSRDSGGRPSY